MSLYKCGYFPTFLAVVFIFMQDKATPALAAVATEGVHTLVLAATILLRALVLICEGTDSLSDFTQLNFYSFLWTHTHCKSIPEKNWALKPFLETVLSDLNSMRMLLY